MYQKMNSTNNTRQAAWIAIGSLFSFGFGIISSMILSRYFDKADYGTYKQVIYVYNTLLAVFTLGLPRAYSYFLPRVSNKEAKSVINKINTLFFILGGIFSLVLFFGSGYIAELMNNLELEKAMKIFSPVPLLMLPTMGLEAILATYQKSKFLALYNIITRCSMLVCVTVPIIFEIGGYIEAIYGFVLASVISFIVALYLKYMPVKQYPKDTTSISYKNIFEFSLPLLYASIWGMVIKSADQFFISRYYGNEVFADYSNGAMELPFIGMIIGACSTVLSPIFSKLQHQQADAKQEFYPIWMSVFKKSAMLIYPILLFCIFFSDIMMVLLYGEQYEVSSFYFCIISIANFFTIIAYAPLVINIGKVHVYSNVHLYSAIILIVLEFIVVKSNLPAYSIAIVSTLCHLGRIFAMLYVVAQFFDLKINQLFPIDTLSKILIPSIIILVSTRLIMSLFDISHIISFTIGGIIYAIIFLLFTKLMKLDYVSIIKPLIKR